MFPLQKKKSLTYLMLLCFTVNTVSSVAAPFQNTAAAEKLQQYIIYSPVQGEALQAVAERFSLSVGTLTALREQFKAYGWSSTAVLVPYSSLGEARLYNNYITYQLKPGLIIKLYHQLQGDAKYARSDSDNGIRWFLG